MSSASERFSEIACVALSALTGTLIVLPFAVEHGLLLVCMGASLGAAIGYRRRKARSFLYFNLLAVLVLASLVSLYLVPK